MICKKGFSCNHRDTCNFIHLDNQPPAPVIPPSPPPQPITKACKFGAKCYKKGCKYVHPAAVATPASDVILVAPPVPVPAPEPQPQPKPKPKEESKKTIFEKAQVIHHIKTRVGVQCKHALGCHSYKCPYVHATVTGYSKKAEEILEKVRQANIIKTNEEKKK